MFYVLVRNDACPAEKMVFKVREIAFFCVKGSFDENKHVTGETFGVTLIVTYETSNVTLVTQH